MPISRRRILAWLGALAAAPTAAKAIHGQSVDALIASRKAEYIEKAVRPPMMPLRNEPISIIPGHITYISKHNGGKGFWPIFEVNPKWLH